MTASSTVTSVASRALLAAGARATIASLNEGSVEANNCKLLYQPTFEALARTANWGCLRAQKTLSLVAAAAGTPENPNGTTLPLPPSPWLYAYSEPVDQLRARFIVPSYPGASTSGIPQTTASYSASGWIPQEMIPFAIAYATDSRGNPLNQILTNQTQAQMVYTVNQPNPVIWDSLFDQAYVLSLAVFLMDALSLNIPLMEMKIKAVDAMIANARAADGNETPVSQDHLPDWVRARTLGSPFTNAIGGTWANPWMSNFPNMTWPVG